MEILSKEKKKCGSELLFKSNISSNDINSIAPKNTFLYNVLKAWSVINEKYNPTRNNIGKTILWNNSIIKVDKKTECYGSWYEKGISSFEHIFDCRKSVFTISIKCNSCMVFMTVNV